MKPKSQESTNAKSVVESSCGKRKLLVKCPESEEFSSSGAGKTKVPNLARSSPTSMVLKPTTTLSVTQCPSIGASGKSALKKLPFSVFTETERNILRSELFPDMQGMKAEAFDASTGLSFSQLLCNGREQRTRQESSASIDSFFKNEMQSVFSVDFPTSELGSAKSSLESHYHCGVTTHRLEKRRNANRESARRCRAKKKVEQHMLHGRLCELEEENRMLKIQLEQHNRMWDILSSLPESVQQSLRACVWSDQANEYVSNGSEYPSPQQTSSALHYF